MYKLIVFDLDGTIADTSGGIIECHRFTLHKMRGEYPSDSELEGVIGAPLLSTYMTRFGFSEERAREAVQIYREHYASSGINNAVVYPEVPLLLSALRERRKKLAVATLKAEAFAKVMLKNLNVDGFFDVIFGVDENDSRTKSQLIELCMRHCGTVPEETLLVGDSEHDRAGAEAAGVDFAAVTYGFGYSLANSPELNTICVIDRPLQLLEFVECNG